MQNTVRLSPLNRGTAGPHASVFDRKDGELSRPFLSPRVYLNMVAGGFKNDLAALNDTTPHDKRYARLVEYTSIIKELLLGVAPVTYRGEFYVIDKLRLSPPLPNRAIPRHFQLWLQGGITFAP